MQNPLTIYSTVKALWKESKPLREWLWDRLPIVKDVKKRDIVEAHLARMLDDANKLAQALPASALDEKITARVEQFRKDIAKEGVTGDEAATLVERANLLARLMVTGPLGDVIDLRFRLAEDEEALRAAERKIEAVEAHSKSLEDRTERLLAQNGRLVILFAISGSVSLIALVVALSSLVSHR
jgi:hypothetical protein